MRNGLVALAFALAVHGGVAVAQERAVPASQAQMKLSFASVVRSAAPSVVNVYGARVERGPQNPFLDDPFFRRFFGDNGFGVPRERAQQSLGSGVIVDAKGLVITNNHVIEGMSEVKVTLADRREFEAEIVLRDPRTDLAVLRLKNATDINAIEMGDADALEVGDIALAIGNPFGVGQTVTQGIVSAVARTQVGISDYQSFIQTDAAINPGNSGGALVDVAGKLVGINTAIFTRTGASHGIGFAIPSTMVRIVLESARTGSTVVRRPWFGGRLQVVSADIAAALGLDRPTGAVIVSVVEDGPAAQGGLRRGDVVLAVDGVAVTDPDSFGYRFATRPLGGITSLSVQRGGQRIVLPVKLQTAPEVPARDATRLAGRSPLTGALAVNLSPAVAEELSIDTGVSGVALAEVPADSTAGQAGLRLGDVIVAVNGQKITAPADLEKLVRTRQRYWEITITRGGRTFTTAFAG